MEKNLKKNKPTEKLIMDQTNKQMNKVISYIIKILKSAVIKIRTAYQFIQSFWLAMYIKLNTQQRIKAKT